MKRLVQIFYLFFVYFTLLSTSISPVSPGAGTKILPTLRHAMVRALLLYCTIQYLSQLSLGDIEEFHSEGFFDRMIHFV